MACLSRIREDVVMRLSSTFVAPLAVAILSTALLGGLSDTAVSQTATGSVATLPSITVVAPKQSARPHRQAANTGASRQTLPATQPAPQKPVQPLTQTPPPAPNSTMAKLAELERTTSNCTDGCQTSFKYGNAPWNGCSGSADIFSPTCRNVRNFKTYYECRDHGLFVGWRNNEIWWYCSSLAAGQKYEVAELKRPGRR
jgi:hypothetical protein